MSIPREEAARALHDIDTAGHHSAAAYRYHRISPHLFLWGVIWVLAYSATFLWPRGWMIWPIAATAGFIASGWIGRRSSAAVGKGAAWRYAAICATLFFFFASLFTVYPPHSGNQVGAVVPLFVALFYAAAGLWTNSMRLIGLGLALGALTVGGYVWLPAYFMLWMAVAGGGALILGGLWFRRI